MTSRPSVSRLLMRAWAPVGFMVAFLVSWVLCRCLGCSGLSDRSGLEKWGQTCKRPPVREVECARRDVAARLCNEYQDGRAEERPRAHDPIIVPRGRGAHNRWSWGQGWVTAPRSAPVTSRAYFASTPVV